MKNVVLIGMPNAGKSTLFNRLSGASARVGNWPGMTVDISEARLLLGGHIARLIDLPGIYDLEGYSDDEAVVRQFLTQQPVDMAMLVLNSTQIDRQLSLALQFQTLGLPALLVLNMADEADKLGMHIDLDRLTQAIGMPITMISAKHGSQCNEALQLAGRILAEQSRSASVSPALAKHEDSQQSTEHLHSRVDAIVQDCVEMPVQMSHKLTQKIDQLFLHPVFGIPLFLLMMFLVFQTVFTLGKPVQDGVAWLFEGIRSGLLEPALQHAPIWLHGLLLDGLYNGVATVAAFVPVIVLFFLIMTVVEDSGYLSRAAFLLDALMSKIGLDGRGFVMMLMGFGCNVPALMGTRVMRSRPMRLLTMLVIPLSLCSARLQVFLFISATIFTAGQAPWVLFGLYLVSFASILLTAFVFKGQFKSQEPLLLELPPYRLPTLRQIVLRGWQEVSHFLRRAGQFIVLGVIGVWALTHFPSDVAVAGPDTYAGMVGKLFEPIMQPIGIDQQMTIALIFGFVAKEIVIGALAVIYSVQGDALQAAVSAQLDWAKGLSFMLFTLIYTPCLSTIVTMRNESGSIRYTLLSIVWSLGLAWVVSFIFYTLAQKVL